MTVTQIKGVQHNAIPSQVDLVIDVRVNDAPNAEIAESCKESLDQIA
jgi:acetylornithine deacetylase